MFTPRTRLLLTRQRAFQRAFQIEARGCGDQFFAEMINQFAVHPQLTPLRRLLRQFTQMRDPGFKRLMGEIIVLADSFLGS